MPTRFGLFMISDVHCMRQADISFSLTVVLHAMCPPTTKSAALTSQNIKSTSDTRTGSFTFLGRETKAIPVVSRSVYQVAFLGIVICKKPISTGNFVIKYSLDTY